METPPITVEAVLQPDGITLQLDKKLALPPGRILVTLHAASQKQGPTMLEVLDRIHRDQQQRGHRPMTEEEMNAEIAQLRSEDEYEDRWQAIWSQTDSRADHS